MDLIGIGSYWITDTSDFTIDANGVITNIQSLTVGENIFIVHVNDTSGNEISALIKVTIIDTTTETRFDPFADDPLRNVPGYPLLASSSFVLIMIAGLLWNIPRYKRKIE